MERGFVYFVTYEDPLCRQRYPFLKIGIAKNVTTRLSGLQTGSPFKLAIVGLIEHDNPYSLEQFLLNKFEANNVSGEWVKVEPRVIGTIKDYPLLIDRFDDFFGNHPVIKEDVRDIEIDRLRERIHKQGILINRLQTKNQNQTKTLSDIHKKTKIDPLCGTDPRKRNDAYLKWTRGGMK